MCCTSSSETSEHQPKCLDGLEKTPDTIPTLHFVLHSETVSQHGLHILYSFQLNYSFSITLPSAYTKQTMKHLCLLDLSRTYCVCPNLIMSLVRKLLLSLGSLLANADGHLALPRGHVQLKVCLLYTSRCV